MWEKMIWRMRRQPTRQGGEVGFREWWSEGAGEEKTEGGWDGGMYREGSQKGGRGARLGGDGGLSALSIATRAIGRHGGMFWGGAHGARKEHKQHEKSTGDWRLVLTQHALPLPALCIAFSDRREVVSVEVSVQLPMPAGSSPYPLPSYLKQRNAPTVQSSTYLHFPL
jgi:hypothetical protein